MKALTLWQPWASLVALGVKTIETRSWSTSHRGPLAIHAATRKPDTWDYEDGCDMGDLGAMCFGKQRGRGGKWHYYLSGDGPHDLPLGEVIATCTLVDVLPMVHSGEEGVIRTLDVDPNGSLWIAEPEDEDSEDYPAQDWREVTDQVPYGDFAPGRFAWLLADIQPVDPPVPAPGRQQLWEWAHG